MMKYLRPSLSILLHRKQSNTGGGEGLGHWKQSNTGGGEGLGMSLKYMGSP